MSVFSVKSFSLGIVYPWDTPQRQYKDCSLRFGLFLHKQSSNTVPLGCGLPDTHQWMHAKLPSPYPGNNTILVGCNISVHIISDSLHWIKPQRCRMWPRGDLVAASLKRFLFQVVICVTTLVVNHDWRAENKSSTTRRDSRAEKPNPRKWRATFLLDIHFQP